MNTKNEMRKAEIYFRNTILAFKAARLKKGYTRKEAGRLCGCSHKAIAQIENGNCNFSEDRIRRLVKGIGVEWLDFEHLRKDPKKVLAEIIIQKPTERSMERKPRRNHYKIVTKEVRAIRILRKRMGLSQYAASRLCGYVPGGFGHIEAGRIELKRNRIDHILKNIGCTWREYDELIAAPVMRDDLIENMAKDLQRLDDHALSSAANIIKALIK